MTRGQYEWRVLYHGRCASHLWWETPAEAIADACAVTQRSWDELSAEGYAVVEWEAQPRNSSQAPIFEFPKQFPKLERKRRKKRRSKKKENLT